MTARQRNTISTHSTRPDSINEQVGDQATAVDAGSSVSHPTRPRRRAKLTPEKRFERFDQLYNFVSERLGYRPAVKTPQVRQSAWIHLFGLATTTEQLEKVTELFTRWRDSRRIFDDHHAEVFVRELPLTVVIFAFSSCSTRPLRRTKLSLSGAQSVWRPFKIRHAAVATGWASPPTFSAREASSAGYRYRCRALPRA